MCVCIYTAIYTAIYIYIYIYIIIIICKECAGDQCRIFQGVHSAQQGVGFVLDPPRRARCFHLLASEMVVTLGRMVMAGSQVAWKVRRQTYETISTRLGGPGLGTSSLKFEWTSPNVGPEGSVHFREQLLLRVRFRCMGIMGVIWSG